MQSSDRYWRVCAPAIRTSLAGTLLCIPALAGSESSQATNWIDDLTPITQADWSYDLAGHLLERAGFGGTPQEVQALAEIPVAAAIDHVVNYEGIDASTLEDFDESGLWDPGMDPFPPSRAEAVRIARAEGHAMGADVLPQGSTRRLQPVVDKFFYGLRSNALETRRLALWWADRMVATPRPLEEKMTLFWHGHFATSEAKVRDYRKLLLQNRTLREHATGNFRDLLMAVMRDPAMLVYLDNGQNIKDHPNENFGRELLELFTMGVGNYTERDIREASRAFTGWTNDAVEFRFDRDKHDDGTKEFLGQRGAFNGDDIIDIILAQPVTAEFVSSKLYRFFVREGPAPNTKTRLARVFREADYELKPLLRAIFLSRDFYSDPSVATQVKSPVQLLVSTYRKLGLSGAPTIPDFNAQTRRLGQALLYPPNVAGWSGGRTWITPATLLERGNSMRDVLFPQDQESFGHPERRLPGIYARVAQRLAQGMNITNATRSGDSGSSMLADADEEYNTRYGGYRGYVLAYERVKLVPRHSADFELAAIVRESGAATASEAVDHLVKRFLRTPLAAADRQELVDLLTAQIGSQALGDRRAELEAALRSVLYVVLCSPEYQVG